MNDMIGGHHPAAGSAMEVDVTQSAALARLIEEVRNMSQPLAPTAYNRTYHRHNR